MLADLGYWTTTPLPIRSWIDRRTDERPDGFAEAVRSWLPVLLDGDAPTRPRSHASIYATSEPFGRSLSTGRQTAVISAEITLGDVTAALVPLSGHQLPTGIGALRSLFRFATNAARSSLTWPGT